MLFLILVHEVYNYYNNYTFKNLQQDYLVYAMENWIGQMS